MSVRRNYVQKATGRRVYGVTTIEGVLAKNALTFWGYSQGLWSYEEVSQGVAKILSGDGFTPEQKVEMALAFITGFKPKGLYEKRDEAADAGTLAHLFVENDLQDRPEPDTKGYSDAVREKAEGCYLSFLSWKDAYKPIVIASEIGLTSEKEPFGGTLDHVIQTVHTKDLKLPKGIKAFVEILDLKTGKGIYLGARIQVAKYKVLWEEHHPEMPVLGQHILRLGPNGEFFHAFHPTLDPFIPIFDHCMAIYYLLKDLGERL